MSSSLPGSPVLKTVKMADNSPSSPVSRPGESLSTSSALISTSSSALPAKGGAGADPQYVGRLLVIEPGCAERHYWRDLWHYRELFAILAWRDVTVRYKQTVIGVAWAVVRPLLATVVFTVVFSKV